MNNNINYHRIAEEIASYITMQTSQVDDSGKLVYYFCGSLVANIMCNVVSFTELKSNDESNYVKTYYLSNEQREAFSKFNRPIRDIDIKFINSNYSDSVPQYFKNEDIKNIYSAVEGAEQFLILEKFFDKDNPFDNLKTFSEATDHSIVVYTTNQGNTFFAVSPLHMLNFKISNKNILNKIIIGDRGPESLKKENMDIEILYNAIRLIYSPEEIAEVIGEDTNIIKKCR